MLVLPRCTGLLGPTFLYTFKPYWYLAQTQKQKIKKAKRHGTLPKIMES